MVLESGIVFCIPDTAAGSPWPCKINPFYEEVKAESEAWFHLFEVFTPEAQWFIGFFNEHDSDQRFWALGIKTSSITAQKHIVETFEHYMDSVVAQSEGCHQCYTQNVEDYFKICWLTTGIDMLYAMLELGYDLQNDVFYHPTVVNIRHLVCELVIIDNDLASFNKEQASEEFPHNILVCVMNQQKCDLDSALLWVGDLHRLISTRFLSLWKDIPTWGPGIDDIASLYLDSIANWGISANEIIARSRSAKTEEFKNKENDEGNGNFIWNADELGKHQGSHDHMCRANRLMSILGPNLNAPADTEKWYTPQNIERKIVLGDAKGMGMMERQ
ncbi:isoprenoid synthase domain-containing protein [Armillaria luteobubalina]|uniref:Isoprenoid synthase domain-containing protein n=1 Tax=Armillaria luteobubalina TaxID=153913 RepID=A0AA39PYS0_9AGAR|nr:isoprenoid synthase domain-containing protein [Armillaria luteobubalina]